MPITYPRPTDVKYVLYRISTSEIIKAQADYPRADGMEIVGADPDYIYLERVSGLVPNYDPRYFERVTTETPILDDGIWDIVHTTQKRPIEDIQLAVENAETNANEQLLPYNRQLKMLLLGVGVCLRQLEAQTLTPKETIIKNRVLSAAVKMWKNDANLQAKVDAIIAGQEPDLDEGWENA